MATRPRNRPNLAMKLRKRKRERLQSQTSKFIPDGDSDFAYMARSFAGHIAHVPDHFRFSAQQIEDMKQAVEDFRVALARTILPSSRSVMWVYRKDEARKKAERLIRSAANIIRVDESISSVDKHVLRVKQRPQKLKRRKCPDVAPELKFAGATLPDGSGPGKHILEYSNDYDEKSCAKPHGAVRLELFVELVPPGEPVPQHPGERSGGRLWYLRSFTNKKMEVEFPVWGGGVPMLVVYWGRWADAKGEVGRFSKTCVARVEGGWGATGNLLPAAKEQARLPGECAVAVQQYEAKYVVLQTPYALPDHLEGDEAVCAQSGKLLPAAMPHNGR